MPRIFFRAFLISVAAICIAPAWTHAQPADPVESARIHLGPVGITPSIAMTGFGIDSNVFREVERARSDVTVTLSPGSRAWVRAGRTLLAMEGGSDLVYFRRYSGEGSLDGVVAARYELHANRFTPWIGGRVQSRRQRAGFEIDARARHGERERRAGVDLRLTSATQIGVSVRRVDYWYDPEARFLDTSLHEALNRRSTGLGLAVSHQLTPLTTVVIEAETIDDRFTFAPSRDSYSRQLVGGVDLEPLALIAGSVRAGYRRFDARGSASDFTGLVGSFDVAYTLLGRTRFAVVGQRELNYSYDVSYPYYVLTGGQLSVTPRLSTHWELQARVGRQQLQYRDRRSVARVDQHLTYGASVGYHLGGSMRVGIDIDRERRKSEAQSRGYEAYRMGVSVTYGR